MQFVQSQNIKGKCHFKKVQKENPVFLLHFLHELVQLKEALRCQAAEGDNVVAGKINGYELDVRQVKEKMRIVEKEDSYGRKMLQG